MHAYDRHEHEEEDRAKKYLETIEGGVQHCFIPFVLNGPTKNKRVP
jgi:hypothetical protein